MSARHLLNNAQNGNFEAAVQVFLNYRDGALDFEKSEEQAQIAFENIIKILNADLFLSTLTLSNFRKILELELNLHKNLTVLIGENGVGKTSLLESIRKNLMWIAATARKENTNGGTIDPDEVNNLNKIQGAYIDCEFQIGDSYKFKGRVARAPEGVNSDLKSDLSKYREIGRNLRILNEYKSINLPLFAIYGIDRLSNDGRQEKTSDSHKIDGYDGSLRSKSSFNIFIDWLIKLLKIANTVFDSSDKIKIQTQVDTLLQTGADNKDHPLYELYENLISVLNTYPDAQVKNQSQKAITFLEELFRKIYPDLSHIELVNTDDGKDKVALNLKHEVIFLHQFSDGQRVLFGLVGDIARRLLLLNDNLDQPFNGRGIVLIDEIELHLHPSWQQKIILILRESFPCIQFIVTTHSPHVLSTVDKNQIRIVKNNEIEQVILQTKGVASSDVLEQIMGTHSIPQVVDEAQWVDNYLNFINNKAAESSEANILFEKLINHFGENHPVISNLRTQIKIASIRNRLSKGDNG
ncbi:MULTISPECIES: AAA family ATPase [Acinetobacter]|uniref:AAA family ATPase n=1 Tax=Acinetobacter TaxID=469 RepID=UPI0015D3B57C|nr:MULTISPECIES: AAA family ATPase [Acinetobacter]MCO8052828.1 AAA family ATPase [Acinetobacter towneri]